MEINPLANGHVLVIPKKETDYIFDIDDPEYIGLWMFAKIVAQAIKDAFPCEKVGVAVVGLEVAHTHIHLIPINHVSDLDYNRKKLVLSDDEFENDAERIRKSLARNTKN